jgi:hypothetical protein
MFSIYLNEFNRNVRKDQMPFVLIGDILGMFEKSSRLIGNPLIILSGLSSFTYPLLSSIYNF